MPTYDFTFIVDTPPMEDSFEDRFFDAGCDDATFLIRHGTVALSFDRESEGYKEAVLSAFEDIKKTSANILRFEPDYLVSAADIAQRTGLTRAAISNYEKKERLQDFPHPQARFSAKSPLWDWVKVSNWLFSHQKIAEVEVRRAQISRVVNFSTQMDARCSLATIQKRIEKILAEPLLDA
jgi:transcriptional regulator with XRE-family HTH domain